MLKEVVIPNGMKKSRNRKIFLFVSAYDKSPHLPGICISC